MHAEDGGVFGSMYALGFMFPSTSTEGTMHHHALRGANWWPQTSHWTARQHGSHKESRYFHPAMAPPRSLANLHGGINIYFACFFGRHMTLYCRRLMSLEKTLPGKHVKRILSESSVVICMAGDLV